MRRELSGLRTAADHPHPPYLPRLRTGKLMGRDSDDLKAAIDKARERSEAYARDDRLLNERAQAVDAELDILIGQLLEPRTVGRYPDTVARTLFDARRELGLLLAWTGAGL